MNKGIAIAFSLIVGLTASGQDIHFSQFNEAPMLLNPALTGMYSGDYRFNLNFKEQWASISSGYKTYAAGGDFVLFKNSSKQKSTGIGVTAFQDVAGASNTKTTRVDLNVSQTVAMETDMSIRSFCREPCGTTLKVTPRDHRAA